jgi:unsaturated rhamnogalacturonyl hydrolase
MRLVADWQLHRAEPQFNQDWTYAALYAGFMAVPLDVNGKKYQEAMLAMGRKFSWKLGSRPEHADDQAIGRIYVELMRNIAIVPRLLPLLNAWRT